jgi:release factor glutamine methyltransferase
MKDSKGLFEDFLAKITLSDDEDEISAVAFMVFENVLGISRMDILRAKSVEPSSDQLSRLEKIAERINQHEPIQYILGEADFFGRKFRVNSAVLIPRPETEELVREVKNFIGRTSAAGNMMDIGTGSGCIAVTLSLEFPHARVYASDVSREALTVAEENSKRLGAKVLFIHHDILLSSIATDDLDIVVSNPPYVTKLEKGQMAANVTRFEPHSALFVPDNDPLIFYKAIASKAYAALKTGGLLAVEINEKFGRDVAQIFFDAGFHDIGVVKDISGKERIVRAIKLG